MSDILVGEDDFTILIADEDMEIFVREEGDYEITVEAVGVNELARVQELVDQATAAASTAAGHESNALAAQAAAEDAQTAAEGARDAALGAQQGAEDAQAAAENAQAAAENAQAAAENAQAAAENAQAAAENAQAAAENAQAAAEGAYDNFDDRYLGAKASDPSLDNDGDALLPGALYWNTVAAEMRAWDDAAGVWKPISGSLNLGGNGIVAQTSSGTFAARTITGGSGITVTDGDGVGGDPIVSLDINGLTEDTAPDQEADFIPIYDASGAVVSKVAAKRIGGRWVADVPIVRHSSWGDQGPVSNMAWLFPGTALSANAVTFYFGFMQRRFYNVRWLVAWNPNTANASDAGIRLVHFDSGPTNVVGLAQFERNNTTSPVVDAVDLTTAFNALIDAGVHKFIGHQTYGNGTTGPVVYMSTLELTWE